MITKEQVHATHNLLKNFFNGYISKEEMDKAFEANEISFKVFEFMRDATLKEIDIQNKDYLSIKDRRYKITENSKTLYGTVGDQMKENKDTCKVYWSDGTVTFESVSEIIQNHFKELTV